MTQTTLGITATLWWLFSTLAYAHDPLPTDGGERATSTRSETQRLSLVSLPKKELDLEARHENAGELPSELPNSIVQSAREVYVWAWPLVYMSNLRQSMKLIRSAGHSGGAPVAPVNQLCMLTDVVSPEFQSVPCPNRDVVYGFGIMDLAEQPIVVQVPDFKDRFWLFQIGDHRMESMGHVGSMYGTQPGFILLVGPEWHGSVPSSIQQVIRSKTNLAYVLPRIVAHTDSSQAASELNAALSQIDIYPLSKFTGQFKHRNWNQARWYPALGKSTREHNRLVRPGNFFDDLERVLTEVAALPSEEHLVALAQKLVHWNKANPGSRERLQQLAATFEQETIQPMFDLSRAAAQEFPGAWATIGNGAAFGDDYWTRTSIAKSNPFVNRQAEAKYYYLESTSEGIPLHGSHTYTLHFAADQLPPVDGFWSLTLYNSAHQFHANAAGRYSIGSLSKPKLNEDGSLTITISSEEPTDPEQVNWLPAPRDEAFKLYLRLYVPQTPALAGSWHPPALQAEAHDAMSDKEYVTRSNIGSSTALVQD